MSQHEHRPDSAKVPGAASKSVVTKPVESGTVGKTAGKADMKYALILNLAILGLIAFVIWLTSNPLALLAVVFLKEMPFGLLLQGEEGEEEGRPIGFLTSDD
jgi:hypothetical protein